ncbi:MAG: hypothetical protein R3E01_07145 [Pirellulaceae bacterium]|nr:hypothetical protein [Planctomycetales bacterium]
MSQSSPVIPSFEDLLKIAKENRWMLIAPTVVMTLAAVGFAVLKTNRWEASQTLMIRDEAVGANGESHLGRFSHIDEMKTTQETVLELVRSRPVVRAALQEVGPPQGYRKPSQWPTLTDVEDARRIVKLNAPNGAEFGKTEIVHLNVIDEDPERAIEFNSSIFRNLDKHFRDVRNQRATSMVDELSRARKLAEEELSRISLDVAKLEHQAGADLPELRILNQSTTGESSIRRLSVDVQNEIRQLQAQQRSAATLRLVLRDNQSQTDGILATPNQLLELQPGLRQLKAGLIEAQLAAARKAANLTPEHPALIEALAAEKEIQETMRKEVSVAIAGLDVDSRVYTARIADLQHRSAELDERMVQLNELRVEYQNLLDAADHQRQIVRTAREDLMDARASLAATTSSSLLTSLDQPTTGDRPVGPGRAMMVLAGMFGGFITGCGLVFLTVQPVQPSTHKKASAQPVKEARVARPDEVATRSLRTRDGLSFRDVVNQVQSMLNTYHN